MRIQIIVAAQPAVGRASRIRPSFISKKNTTFLSLERNIIIFIIISSSDGSFIYFRRANVYPGGEKTLL